jgi:hypothetical protein
MKKTSAVSSEVLCRWTIYTVQFFCNIQWHTANWNDRRSREILGGTHDAHFPSLLSDNANIKNFKLTDLLHLWLYSPLLDIGRFFNFLIFYIDSRSPWTGDQPVTRPLPAHTGQHKYRINAHRHPCLKWDSNPRSQFLSGRRRFMFYTVLPLWSAQLTDTHAKLYMCSSSASSGISVKQKE